MISNLFRISLGFLLILFGLVALVIPVLPTWIFIAFGMLILAGDVPYFARLICRIEHRFPRIGGFSSRIRSVLTKHGVRPFSCPPKG